MTALLNVRLTSIEEQVVARRAVKFDLYGMVDPQGLVSS